MPQRGVGGVDEEEVAGVEELEGGYPMGENRGGPKDGAIGEEDREACSGEGEEGGVWRRGGAVCRPDEGGGG